MSPVLPVVDCLVLGGCALHEQNEARDDAEEGRGRPLGWRRSCHLEVRHFD